MQFQEKIIYPDKISAPSRIQFTLNNTTLLPQSDSMTRDHKSEKSASKPRGIRHKKKKNNLVVFPQIIVTIV